jgi:predicted nuclease with RNAse H fold
MMAADLACFHNLELPEDSDGSGSVTPLDVLAVINQVNNATSGTTTDSSVMVDVDADNTVSPLDALSVINYLNRQAEGEADLSSNVPVDRRIRRIESAINSDQLGSRYSLEQAIEILATLRAGRRPELGDQFAGPGPSTSRHGGEDSDSSSSRFLNHLVERLTDAGVSEEIITTIRTEIQDAADAGTPLSLSDVKTRLTELGVDVSTIFPTPQDRFIAQLTSKLEQADVSAEIIATIVGEIEAAAEAGAPLTKTEIKTRLTELGVDVSTVFPTREDKFVEHLTNKLEEANVSTEIITTIVDEIEAAVDAGTPLTLAQIQARLTELGVDVTNLFPTRPTQHHGSPLARVLEQNGVDPEIIQTITDEMDAAKEAGTPMTREAVLARLEELGVDTSNLELMAPPPPPHGRGRRR